MADLKNQKETKVKDTKVKDIKVKEKSESKKSTEDIVLKVPAENFYGTGKRKAAIAKVWIFKGKGSFVVNNISAIQYLGSDILLNNSMAPLAALDRLGQYDVVVKTIGGGLSGQSDAISLGISRALLAQDDTVRSVLKDKGLLTRDSRVKERKKYGRKKARKGYQFRKR